LTILRLRLTFTIQKEAIEFEVRIARLKAASRSLMFEFQAASLRLKFEVQWKKKTEISKLARK
jgi:hypothetical protein